MVLVWSRKFRVAGSRGGGLPSSRTSAGGSSRGSRQRLRYRNRASDLLGTAEAAGFRVARRKLQAIGKNRGGSLLRADIQRHPGDADASGLEQDSTRPPSTPWRAARS